MNDTVMSVIAIFLAAVLMFIFPLMSTADRTDDISQQAVQTAVTEFVDNVRSTGRITQDKYNSFTQRIAETGNSFKVGMEAQIQDESSKKKTTEASASKVGENSYYSVFTSQIEDTMSKNGSFNLKEGDIFSTTVENTNKTIGQILKNFFYQVTGNNTYNIAAQHSGIVNVNAMNK
ncbi:MAG: hypothetical protein IKG14_03235 [Clostridia bacterium]|nr:hypothetical protein [Clostridia bacterium]